MLRSRAVRDAVLFFLALCALASPARAQIFQPGTQPVGHPDGLVDLIQDSRTCRRCHANYEDALDVEPYDSWRGAMMSHAGRDPIALAALAIAEEDVGDAADFCVRCHSPTGWLAGRSELPAFDDASPTFPERLRRDGPLPGMPSDPTRLSGQRDGVACMVCHRMQDGSTLTPPSEAILANAQLVIADGAEADTRRGPYAYAPGDEPMHPTVQDPFISSAALCGSCHDIHNPLHDGFRGGGPPGTAVPTGRRFAIERTYSEWLNSAFATRDETCQDCHMPEVEARAAGDALVRPTMSRHDLAGGSVWQTLALAALVRDLDPEAAGHLEASSMRARAMLERAARLEITASALAGASATATVRVTNESGHKLPTGYPEGRRMWLEVAVVDAAGRVVAGSGLYDEATATLDRDAQLRTYEVHLGQAGVEGFHFVLNDTLLEDTRIPPEGFTAPEAADIAPLGRDYGDGAGGYRNYDETSYTLADLCGEGTLTLRARLRYQSTTREYIEFLRDNADVPSMDPQAGGRSWGAVAYEAWQTHGGDLPVDMEEVSVVLGASPGPCPEPDAGPPDGGPGVDAGPEPLDAGGGIDAGAGPTPTTCGCRVGDAGSPIAAISLVLLAAALIVIRRRR